MTVICQKRRVNQKGRNQPSTRFARLDHAMLTSRAYRALSPQSRSLLIEIIMLYNGKNNGSLYLSVRDAADRMGVSDLSAASKAFDQLIEMGFIEMTKDAHFAVKTSATSRARCWRLYWESGPDRKRASEPYLTREPKPKTKEWKRMDKGLRALKRYRQAKSSDRLPVWESNIWADEFETSGSGFHDGSPQKS